MELLVVTWGSLVTFMISGFQFALRIQSAAQNSASSSAGFALKLAKRYDAMGTELIDERQAKLRKRLLVSGSIYVVSLLTGFLVMLLAKKFHG